MRLFELLLLLAPFAQLQVPDTDVTIPAHAQVALQAQGRGVQIYRCATQGIAYEWAFQAPEARLYDASGAEVGNHGAGPTWTWKDGSSITGKLLAQRVSPSPLNINWLLLAATPASSSAGALSRIAFVRRSETEGGIPPADGCDAAHVGATVRVPYSADYTFYMR
jgi:hypothetical protein